MVSTDELRVFEFDRAQGRKFGVAIDVEGDANPAELERALSILKGDEETFAACAAKSE